MKEFCLCIVRETQEVHSIGILMHIEGSISEGRYYSPEGAGYFDLDNDKLFDYREMDWADLRKLLDESIQTEKDNMDLAIDFAIWCGKNQETVFKSKENRYRDELLFKRFRNDEETK